MSYSPLAQKLLALTKQVARRYGSSTISESYLLGAIAEWDIKGFLDRHEDRAKELETLLRTSASTSGDLSNVPEGVDLYLKKISAAVNVWEICDLLIAFALNNDSNTSESVSTDSAEKVKGASNPENSVFGSDVVNRIVDATRIPIGEVEEMIAQDLVAVSAWVSGLQPNDDRAREYVKKLSGLSVEESPNDKSMSNILQLLASSEIINWQALAREIAERYIRLGSQIAESDGFITPDEWAKIDELKNELKRRLGPSLKTPNKVQLRFYSHFEGLVGLGAVKRALVNFVQQRELDKLRSARGLPVIPQTMHMAFLGSPGTGKTEVARRLGAALKDLNFLQRGHFVEVDRADLIAEYVGHTEKKTRKVIQSAIGGILFIDEAYSLADRYGDSKGFGVEALDVLVREMENHRHELVVIFAGYQHAMKTLFSSNEGLDSRVPLQIDFAPYTSKELLEIAENMMRAGGLVFGIGARELLAGLFDRSAEDKGFGGARGARNIYEEIRRRQAARISEYSFLATLDDLRTVEMQDIPTQESVNRDKFGKIGYL